MSVAYRIKHENGDITEVEYDSRLMTTPDYLKLYTDYDGVPVYQAPKEYSSSKPVQFGVGVRGRLEAYLANKKEKAEYKQHIEEGTQEGLRILQEREDFQAWRDKKKTLTNKEYHEDLADNSKRITSQSFDERVRMEDNAESHQDYIERSESESNRVVAVREQLKDLIASKQDCSGFEKINLEIAKERLETIELKYDEDGYLKEEGVEL